MEAKYYVYRNLHIKGNFSVKHRGLVVDRQPCMMTRNVEFRVSKAGSERAKTTKQRNVHAYAVCDMQPSAVYGINLEMDRRIDKDWVEITYNPFKNDCFMWKTKKALEPVVGKVAEVQFDKGRVYGKRS